MTSTGTAGSRASAPGPARFGRWVPDVTGLTARTVVLVVAGLAASVLVLVVTLLPVPYVVFAPGPVRDTLGENSDGEPLIVIEGAETYPTEGELDLTTISVSGGPARQVGVFEAIRAYLDPTLSLRPVDSVFPSGSTREESREASVAQMVAAQQSAAVAALLELGTTVPTRLVIAGFAGDTGAEDVLATDDVITAVEGTGLDSSGALIEEVQSYDAGDSVAVTVERAGEQLELELTLGESPEGSAILGVLVAADYDLPYEVAYDVGGIGGPSAGLMFALGIYDKLTPGPLTGGQTIAGTGTISDDGAVGPIDGIQQKLVGAQGVGATWFLAPAANCPDVVGAVPDGLGVTAVATLEEALAAIELIAAADGDPVELPSCEDVLAG